MPRTRGSPMRCSACPRITPAWLRICGRRISKACSSACLRPGWLHGCLGLNFAFKRRPLFRQLRFVLFAVALLLPVFSALGFIAMGRELSTNPAVAAAAQEYLGPAHAEERTAIERWRNTLLVG